MTAACCKKLYRVESLWKAYMYGIKKNEGAVCLWHLFARIRYICSHCLRSKYKNHNENSLNFIMHAFYLCLIKKNELKHICWRNSTRQMYLIKDGVTLVDEFLCVLSHRRQDFPGETSKMWLISVELLYKIYICFFSICLHYKNSMFLHQAKSGKHSERKSMAKLAVIPFFTEQFHLKSQIFLGEQAWFQIYAWIHLVLWLMHTAISQLNLKWNEIRFLFQLSL